MTTKATTSTEIDHSMEDLLFMINLSLKCLEMRAMPVEQASDSLTLEMRDKAISHYAIYLLGYYIKKHGNGYSEPIISVDALQDLLSNIEVENHCKKVVIDMAKIKSIDGKIKYIYNLFTNHPLSKEASTHLSHTVKANEVLIGNLAEMSFFEGLIKRAKITATEEWSMKYMPKVEQLRKKSERINELILNYSYDDYLYHWIAVVNKAITVVTHKLDGSLGKSQMIGVLFLLTLFKEAGLNVKDERSLKEFLETILDIDKITAKTYLHRLKNRNENLYKSREGYFDTAIEQIKSVFGEDTELRRKLIQNFESYKRDRQTISEVIPPNRLTKND